MSPRSRARISLLSIVQMPAGIPVGTLAIGKPGAINAALLAVSVLALNDKPLAKKLRGASQGADRQRRRNGRRPIGDIQTGKALKRCSHARTLRSHPARPSAFLVADSSPGMLAQAASRLGLNCHIFAPDQDGCAFDVVSRATHADYDDQDALAKFAEDCDAITYEFENVPSQTAAFLSQRRSGAARSAHSRDHAGPAGRKGIRGESGHRHGALRARR